MVKCKECHFFVMLGFEKGMCMLAKQFLIREEFDDNRVACDFWKPYTTATVKKNGKLQYVKVNNENVDDDSTKRQDA